MKILILGGYGVFGGRLAELLSDLPAVELLICGRNLANAQKFCAHYRGRARVRPIQLDRREIEDGLRSLMPDLVVDASGPFQDYGAERYGVISSCIAAKINYGASDLIACVRCIDLIQSHMGGHHAPADIFECRL